AHIQVVDAGVADGGEDAAEVGVGGEEGGLDGRGLADGVADLAVFGAVAAAFDYDGDELGGAFAVADDGVGEFDGDGDDGFAQGEPRRRGIVCDFAVAGFAGSHQDVGVVGGGVAVDGDAVEGQVGRFAHQALEQRL